MRILVTGGAGYLGSVLAPVLIENGHQVTVLDNFRYGQELALASCCAWSDFELVRGDVRDYSLMKRLLAEVDAVVHLAAIVGAPACDRHPRDAVSVNEYATADLVNRLSPDQLLVYPNTNSGYGVGSDEPCTEESPLAPLSLYGRTKAAGEEAALARQNTIVFRLATVFGASPRMRTDLLVNDLTLRAVRDGSLVLYEGNARRNFVHVRDVADAFCWVFKGVDGTVTTGPVYNLGNDAANVAKRQLCDLIAQEVADFKYRDGPGEDPDKRDYLVSNERLARAGFVAKRGLREGVRELAKLYRGFNHHRHGNM